MYMLYVEFDNLVITPCDTEKKFFRITHTCDMGSVDTGDIVFMRADQGIPLLEIGH